MNIWNIAPDLSTCFFIFMFRQILCVRRGLLLRRFSAVSGSDCSFPYGFSSQPRCIILYETAFARRVFGQETPYTLAHEGGKT